MNQDDEKEILGEIQDELRKTNAKIDRIQDLVKEEISKKRE